VVVEGIDPVAERLRYFHNTGLYELEGDDFRGVFRIGLDDPSVLPPYAEIVRFDAGAPLHGAALRAAARGLLRHHLERRPATNPFERFGDALARTLPELLAGDAAGYHAYAFATVRMAGSAFELLAAHADWLLGDGAPPVTEPLDRIVNGCKLLSFKLARRRPFDPAPAVAGLAGAWEEALERLDALAR
jgi:hypothetical protein